MIRRRVELGNIEVPLRRDVALALVETVRSALAEAHPSAEGFVHRLDWSPAPCAAGDRVPEELKRFCQQARLGVERGAWWGVEIRIEPLQQDFRSVRIVVKEALPAIVQARGAVVVAAAAIGLVTGVIAAIAGVAQGERKPVGIGLILGLIVALGVGAAGLLLLQPFVRLAAFSLRRAVRATGALVDRSWSQVQTRCGIGDRLEPMSSPVVVSFVVFLLTGGLTLAGVLVARHVEIASVAAVIGLYLGIGVFGLAAAFTLVALAAYALDIVD